ncbi:MAG: hypothetical protein AAFY60_08075 [Myxococcota bacterium]
MRHSLAFACVTLVACGGGTEISIPDTEPPVTEATPTGLRSSSGSAAANSVRLALNSDDLKSRFYSQGPTEIASLLRGLDGRMNEIETRAAEDIRPCLEGDPVPMKLNVLGETVTAYFQCHDVFGDGTGGILFGEREGVWYLFENVGQVRQLAMIEPQEEDTYSVDAFISVGQRNETSIECDQRYDGCSYGAIRLRADSAQNTLELSTAGVPNGWGFCAAHLKSDGVSLYSAGQGVIGGSCTALSERCVLGADLTGEGDCSGLDADDLLLPVLGTQGEAGLDTERLDVELRFSGTDDDAMFGPEPGGFLEIDGVTAF